MTKESFISICWRLVPYWLNNWEHQWGAECSSMMFELPHFAMELLVVLPCVQVSAEAGAVCPGNASVMWACMHACVSRASSAACQWCQGENGSAGGAWMCRC